MKANIALIGFMGSGKTTVGRQLAKALDMKFIDIDKMISAREKKSVSEIFTDNGEKYFRELERDIIEEESRENNIVIATGGGAIIDNENLKNLKKTSFVVYLDASLECVYERIKNSKHRPLIAEAEDVFATIKELYDKRLWLYKISGDYSVQIEVNTLLRDTVENIKVAYIRS